MEIIADRGGIDSYRCDKVRDSRFLRFVRWERQSCDWLAEKRLFWPLDGEPVCVGSESRRDVAFLEPLTKLLEFDCWISFQIQTRFVRGLQGSGFIYG